MHAKTTLISQAKSDFDALISVQSVLDLETDFSAEILAPVDLFNILFYYRSESTVDADDALPDLEFAMDPEAWNSFLKLEVGQQLFGAVDAQGLPITFFNPKFGTVPFSEGDMVSGNFNPTAQGANPTITNDDSVATHYAYWIMSILFGANGIGFTANFEQLIGSIVNKNASFNDSLKRLVNLNGGHLPATDISRQGTNARYKTPSSAGTEPREGGRVTSVQGVYSNNPGQQVIQSMADDNREETVRRLLESLKKVSYPLRVEAAIAANNNAANFTDVSGVLFEPVTGIQQINPQLMNHLDLNNLNNPNIFTHFLAPDLIASGNEGLQSYSGIYILSEAEYLASGLGGTKPATIRIPEIVYSTFSSSGWNTTNFVPLTEWIDGDSFSMLLALASENQAVVNTSVLNSGQSPQQQGTSFVPNLSTRGLFQSKNGFFTNTTYPSAAALAYQQTLGGNDQSTHAGGLYDKEVQIAQDKLLGWRLASMKIKLSNKLSQGQCALLAAWAKIMAVIHYLTINDFKNKDPTGETEEVRQLILQAKSMLSRENWRVSSDAEVASSFIEMELSRRYQGLFKEIDAQCRIAETDPTNPQLPAWYAVLIGNDLDKAKMHNIAQYYLNEYGMQISQLLTLANGLGSETQQVVTDAQSLYHFLIN
jgi:hypothetical protein